MGVIVSGSLDFFHTLCLAPRRLAVSGLPLRAVTKLELAEGGGLYKGGGEGLSLSKGIGSTRAWYMDNILVYNCRAGPPGRCADMVTWATSRGNWFACTPPNLPMRK